MLRVVEVIEDILSFIDASPEFLSVSCEKLRKSHGPNFKMSTVKALLHLRSVSSIAISYILGYEPT